MATPGINTRNYARYAYESVYRTAASDANLSTYFGRNVKISASRKNNLERIADLGTRNYSSYAAKKFEGTFTADFQVSNFYFLKGVIGTATTTGGGPYEHKYAESNTPSGATIQISEDLDTDSEQTLVGCVFDKASVNFTVGDPVTGRLDGFYASESKDSTLNTTGNQVDADDVFTFSHAYLQIPAATTIGLVQSVEMSISNNAELIWQLNNRTAQQRAFKQRVYEFRINKIREQDTDILDTFYGSTTTLSNPGTPASGASLVLACDNNAAGTARRRFVMRVDAILPEDYSANIEPYELVKENSTFYALNLNVASGAVFTNNSANHP